MGDIVLFRCCKSVAGPPYFANIHPVYYLHEATREPAEGDGDEQQDIAATRRDDAAGGRGRRRGRRLGLRRRDADQSIDDGRIGRDNFEHE
jgi:hypothetical protein